MNNRLHPLTYLLPFVVFLYLIHGTYSNGYLNLYVDAKINYLYTNYFLNNIARGVYPFWNPFTSWGRPDDLLAHMMGEFNPFLYMTLVLEKLGMAFSRAYFVYLIMYFSIGIAGVYFLAKQLFKDPLIASLACVSVMFSNLSGNLFNNILVVLIFVPSIWFFYFLISFARIPRKAALLGAVFCLMILLTTYMPFHFLVIFLVFSILYACFYFKDLISCVVRAVSFFSKNIKFSSFCLFSLVLSLIPGLLWYRSNLAGNVVYGWRGFENSLHLDINMINSGNFIAMHALMSPFSNLQDSELCTLYIPSIFILIALLGIVLPITRRRSLLFAMGIFFFLLTSTNASPLMGFLFNHIFFFKYFRNTHFFVWAFGAIMTLLVMDILQGLIQLPLNERLQRTGMCMMTIVLHAAVLVILTKCWAVNDSTYITLAFSFIFFILYFTNILKKEHLSFSLMVLILILFQPVEVLWNIEHKANISQQFAYSLKPYTLKESKPIFDYLRPTALQETRMIDTEHRGDISDRSGFLKDMWQYHGTRWSWRLLKDFGPRTDIQEYVRHKFVLYPSDENVTTNPSGMIPAGKWIDQDSDQFKVNAFGMNDIKFTTAYDQSHLLVYNDSFYPGWKASINGKQVPIALANMAFKGIYLPAGKNVVLLTFHAPWFRGFYLFLILYFCLVLAILLALLSRQEGNNAVI